MFSEVSGTRRVIQLVMVTTFGARQNMYSFIVQDETMMDDLYAEK